MTNGARDRVRPHSRKVRRELPRNRPEGRAGEKEKTWRGRRLRGASQQTPPAELELGRKYKEPRRDVKDHKVER